MERRNVLFPVPRKPAGVRLAPARIVSYPFVGLALSYLGGGTARGEPAPSRGQ